MAAAPPDTPLARADHGRWPQPTDHAVTVYTWSADGVYGEPAIHETAEIQAPGLFPDLLVDWGLMFPDTTVRPLPLPAKDSQ